MAKPPQSQWSIEQIIFACAIAIIVGGGAVAFYPTIKATLDAWSAARQITNRNGGDGCATPEGAVNAQAVFCHTGRAAPGAAPTTSAVDTPLGSVRRMDTLLKP